jgi:hypothetical protein
MKKEVLNKKKRRKEDKEGEKMRKIEINYTIF